jgi:hypothetical protein
MSRCAIRWAWCVVVAAPLADAAPVPATKADETVPVSAARLLRFRKVQKELQLTAEQRITVIDGLEDIEEAYQSEIDRLIRMVNSPPDQFEKAEQRRRKSMDKFLMETAARRLTAGQRLRLRQVDWQARGPAAFTDPRIEQDLQLTDDQKKAVAALTERQHGLVLQLMDQRGNDTEEQFKTDLRTFRTEAVAQFVESLKPDQRATWKALLGEPVKSFDLYELWICAIQEDDWELTVPSGPEPSALR